MRNFKLTIQYDGTNYHGFQIQPVAVTIQKVLETNPQIQMLDMDI